VVALCVLLLAAGAAVWYGREALLRGAAQLWIDSDTIGDADAEVALGGGLLTRPFAAAEYYRHGMVRKVLVSNVRRDKAERGISFPYGLESCRAAQTGRA
jgi:hypothetical protein